MRVIQERVVTKMDTVIGHVSDLDIALGDRMKCQTEKSLGRNSDLSSSQSIWSHRQAVDQVYKTLNRLRIFEGFNYFICCTRHIIYFHAFNIAGKTFCGRFGQRYGIGNQKFENRCFRGSRGVDVNLNADRRLGR